MKNKISGIYLIESPNNSIYIGLSKNIKKRWSNYKALNCKAQLHLYSSFLLYGVENHKFSIIEECPVHLLNEREIFWENYYRSLNYNFLNVKPCGGSKVNHAESTKNKLREINLGKKLSDDTKRKIGIASKNMIRTKDHYNKISNALKGKPLSTQTKIKLSLSHKGKKMSFDDKEKLAIRMMGESSPISVLNNNIVQEIMYNIFIGMKYKSIAKEIGISHRTVYDVISGKTWNSITGIPKKIHA